MKNSFKLAVMRIEDSVFVSVADSALANLKGVILLLCAVLSFSAYNILARKLVGSHIMRGTLGTVLIILGVVGTNYFTQQKEPSNANFSD